MGQPEPDPCIGFNGTILFSEIYIDLL